MEEMVQIKSWCFKRQQLHQIFLGEVQNSSRMKSVCSLTEQEKKRHQLQRSEEGSVNTGVSFHNTVKICVFNTCSNFCFSFYSSVENLPWWLLLLLLFSSFMLLKSVSDCNCKHSCSTLLVFQTQYLIIVFDLHDL